MNYKMNPLFFVIVTSLFVSSCSQQLSTGEHIQKGQKFQTEKQWNSAVIEFKNAVKQSPGKSAPRALLGRIYLKVYASHAAVKELKKAIELGVDKSSVIVALGKAYIQLNQADNLLTEIQPDNKYNDDINADIYALRAKAYIKLTKINKAKEQLTKASSLNNNSTEVRLAWALYEFKSDDLEKQREWLAPLLERNGGIADAWSHLAGIEQKSKEYEKAEKAYSRAINIRNFVHFDYLRRALLRIDQKNYEGATSDISMLKKAGISWPIVVHAEGVIAYQQKKWDQAISLFDQVISKSPEFTPAQLMMGMAQFYKGNFQSSSRFLKQYLISNPDAFQANFIYSTSLLKLGKVSEAIPILIKLNKQQTDDFRVTSMLGSAYIASNQIEKGVSLLKKSVELKPDLASTRLQLGSALMGSGTQIELAQQEIIKAIELDPELTRADLVLFASYMRQQKFKDARAIARDLSMKQEKISTGDNLVALTLLAEEKKVEAIELLKGTLKRFPSDPLTSNNLASLYIQEKQLDLAKNIYMDVLQKEPGHIKTLNKMALIAAKEKKAEEVTQWLVKAVKLNPGVSSPKLLLATHYLRQNKALQSIQVLQEVSDKDKSSTGYILLLANAKMGIKEYQHATRALKGLISKDSKLSSAHFLLAQAYGYQNDAENMRKSLEDTVRILPDHLRANLILARLDLKERKIDIFKQRVAVLMSSYPDNKDVQFLNAKIEFSDKGYSNAIKTLSSLMEESPHAEVIIDLVRNYWQIGDRESAISNLELWVQENTDDTRALMLLAQYYQTENRNDEARIVYQKLDKALPNNSAVLNNLAWLMLETDVKKGLSYAEKAFKKDPESPYILDTFAILLLKNGENAKALEYSKKASKIVPNFVDIQINYAKILNANNKIKQARDLLNDLYYKTKSPSDRKKIQKELEGINFQ